MGVQHWVPLSDTLGSSHSQVTQVFSSRLTVPDGKPESDTMASLQSTRFVMYLTLFLRLFRIFQTAQAKALAGFAGAARKRHMPSTFM